MSQAETPEIISRVSQTVTAGEGTRFILKFTLLLRGSSWFALPSHLHHVLTVHDIHCHPAWNSSAH